MHIQCIRYQLVHKKLLDDSQIIQVYLMGRYRRTTDYRQPKTLIRFQSRLPLIPRLLYPLEAHSIRAERSGSDDHEV